MLFASAIVSTAVCSTSGDCRCTQRLLSSCFETSLRRRCSCCPYRKCLATPDILLCRSCPALWTQGQLEKDGNLLPACTPERVLPSSHYHWRDCVEDRSPVHLPGVYNHIRRQDRQESGQQTGQVKQRFRQTVQQSMENKHLKKGTKISLYRAVVLTTLMYGSESWVTYRHHLQLLDRFHQRCLRIVLNIHWSDYVSIVKVLEHA